MTVEGQQRTWVGLRRYPLAHNEAIIRLFAGGMSVMKLTDNIFNSPHAVSTQLGNETVILMRHRPARFALSDRLVRLGGGRTDWNAPLPKGAAHLEDANCS